LGAAPAITKHILSPKGIAFTGSLLSFYNGEWVCESQQPFSPRPASPDIVDWFSNHPLLTFTTVPHERDNPIAAALGTQFDVEVNATDDKLVWGIDRPTLPSFPDVSRSGPFVINKGNKNRFIVLEVEDETLVVFVESLPDEFVSFCDRVEEVLAEVR
jgi:hypothetical protein